MKRLLLLLFPLFILHPMTAMEPIPLTMQDEETPLMAPQHVLMNEHKDRKEKKSIIFNQTRRYFDEASYKIVRNKAIKDCLLISAGTGAAISCLGCCCSQPLAWCIVQDCTGTTNGCIFCHQAGGAFFESCVVSGGVTSCCGFGCPALCCMIDQVKTLVPDATDIKWGSALNIPSEILNATNKNKLIPLKKELVRMLISNSPTTRGSLFHKLVFCTPIPSKQTIALINQRLHSKMAVKLFHILKKQYKLPKDIISYLFKFIDFKTLDKYTYLSENELVYLLQNRSTFSGHNEYTPLIHTYAQFILLAEHGWVHFTHTKKYPIKCEPKYFDKQALSEAAQQLYCAPEGPTIYLPYSRELAKYYKFEEDPEYQEDTINPRNALIRTLLAERKIKRN